MHPRQIDTVEDYPLYQIDCDVNGNSRYVVHFLVIPFRKQREMERALDYVQAHYEYAKKALYGKAYRAKWFGGGIVFTAPEGARKRVEYAVNRVQVDLELITTEVEHDSIKITPLEEINGAIPGIVTGIFAESESEWNRIADIKLRQYGIECLTHWDSDGHAKGIRRSL